MERQDYVVVADRDPWAERNARARFREKVEELLNRQTTSTVAMQSSAPIERLSPEQALEANAPSVRSRLRSGCGTRRLRVRLEARSQ